MSVKARDDLVLAGLAEWRPEVDSHKDSLRRARANAGRAPSFEFPLYDWRIQYRIRIGVHEHYFNRMAYIGLFPRD